MSDSPIRCEAIEGGAALRIALARPKANILDRAMGAAIRAAVAGAAPEARAILFTAEGPHFSFGASVAEHRAGEVEAMLPEFHALFRDLARSRKVLVAAVRGQCLGGGLELAAFCHRVVAAPDAKLGSPEIQLGVFAPIASIVLPLRLGQRAADDLLLTGRSAGAEEAARLGLIDEIADDPEAAARAWIRTHLSPKSAAALALACEAARSRLHDDLGDRLARLERLYLADLMRTRDANEGIAAFLEKRSPTWTHR